MFSDFAVSRLASGIIYPCSISLLCSSPNTYPQIASLLHNMPLQTAPYPHVFNALNGPTAPAISYIVFYSNIVDGQMWCPDCRAVENVVKEAFDAPDKPNAAIFWVGNRQEWRTPNNQARTEWNVNSVPTILRLENGKETGRLVEDEILDKARLQAFIK
ncbi:hypothetical protein C366_02271 [Cryptococcus neoformans Tu401-1]|nr:hypothetical protein C366_02271 [Cryptococcus neoformans var. grubii Tu401-1]